MTDATAPDVYRIRILPGRRFQILGIPFGRRATEVEIDYLGAGDPQVVEAYWTDSTDDACAEAFAVDMAREHHEHIAACSICLPDGGPLGHLVVYRDGSVLIDERVNA